MFNTIGLGISPYFTKLSRSSMFLRSLMYSPIIFLSSRGFSLSHWATWLLSKGLLRRPFSCRNWIPFLGFWLNCSVPVISSWKHDKEKGEFEGGNSNRVYNWWRICNVTENLDQSITTDLFLRSNFQQFLGIGQTRRETFRLFQGSLLSWMKEIHFIYHIEFISAPIPTLRKTFSPWAQTQNVTYQYHLGGSFLDIPRLCFDMFFSLL